MKSLTRKDIAMKGDLFVVSEVNGSFSQAKHYSKYPTNDQVQKACDQFGKAYTRITTYVANPNDGEYEITNTYTVDEYKENLSKVL